MSMLHAGYKSVLFILLSSVYGSVLKQDVRYIILSSLMICIVLLVIVLSFSFAIPGSRYPLLKLFSKLLNLVFTVFAVHIKSCLFLLSQLC